MPSPTNSIKPPLYHFQGPFNRHTYTFNVKLRPVLFATSCDGPVDVLVSLTAGTALPHRRRISLIWEPCHHTSTTTPGSSWAPCVSLSAVVILQSSRVPGRQSHPYEVPQEWGGTPTGFWKTPKRLTVPQSSHDDGKLPVPDVCDLLNAHSRQGGAPSRESNVQKVSGTTKSVSTLVKHQWLLTAHGVKCIFVFHTNDQNSTWFTRTYTGDKKGKDI